MKKITGNIKCGAGLVILSLTMATMVSMPVYAKTASWSFTMKNRLVDGSTSGKYYSIKKDTNVYISGTIDAIKQKAAADEHSGLSVYLCRERFGRDEEYASCYIGKGNKKFNNKKLGKTTETDSKYYLIFYKGSLDNYTLKGQGEIKY